MKVLLFFGIALITGTFAACLSTVSQNVGAADIPVSVNTEPSGIRQPVLVELYTSEGCSSCPPADRLLTSLQNDDVIALEFHVDYWDSSAWRDPFSSNAYTKRQENYSRALGLDSTYTPQMIVDGRHEFVGSNRSKATETIAKSGSDAKTAIDLTTTGEKLNVKIDGLKDHTDAAVYLAATETKLTTRVGGGENSGSTLDHSSVVREFMPIGMIKKGDAGFQIEYPKPQNAKWKIDNLHYVVFVQEKSSLKVLAVKQIAAK